MQRKHKAAVLHTMKTGACIPQKGGGTAIQPVKKLAARITAGLNFVCSRFGCSGFGIVDGPGMVNDLPWNAFTLSRNDSFAQYNFWFTVQTGDTDFLLTGECRDEDGTLFILEAGTPLSAADVIYLRSLRLGDLADFISDDTDDDLILLDAPSIHLQLTFLDGTQREKVCSSDISIQLYTRFLPYFQKRNKYL